MKTLRFVAVAAILPGVLVGRTFAAGPEDGDAPFGVEIFDVADDVPRGLPAMVFGRLANVSGKEQPTAFLHTSLRLYVLDGPESAMHCRETDRLERAWNEPLASAGPRIPDLLVNRRSRVPPRWAVNVEGGFLPPEPGEYSVILTFAMGKGTEDTVRLEEPQDGWVGSVSTRPVKVRAVEPEAADAVAFQHFSEMVRSDSYCSRARRFVFAFGPSGPATWEDLLRRYPDSVYTAEYVVRKLLQMGIQFPPADITVSRLGRDINELDAEVPCPPPNRCLKDGTVYLRGADYIRWKLAWCERILEHHPKVWFADGVRYAAATYRFQLGDKAGCAAQLRDLAQHGRPYVAAKAAELLAALQAKGMLEETTK